MNKQHITQQTEWSLVLAMSLLAAAITPSVAVESSKQSVTGCPPSTLEQTTVHVVQPNDTIESIATAYNLVPSSILAMNPELQSGSVAAGNQLKIPPYNGSVYNVPSGTTWQELADQFGMRADVLFESNGCGMTPPSTVFIPGLGDRISTGPIASPQPAQAEPLTFNTLPLQNEAAIALGYGWHQQSSTEPAAFHSGIDFDATLGSPVITVGDGTVAFAGEKGNYGNVIVINHERGVQTRYAQLSEINVSIGDTISTGDIIGRSGQSGTVLTPHLHFEVRLNSPSGWVAQDPYLYLNVLD